MEHTIAMHDSPPPCMSCPTLSSSITTLQTQVKLLTSQVPSPTPTPSCPRCLVLGGENGTLSDAANTLRLEQAASRNKCLALEGEVTGLRAQLTTLQLAPPVPCRHCPALQALVRSLQESQLASPAPAVVQPCAICPVLQGSIDHLRVQLSTPCTRCPVLEAGLQTLQNPAPVPCRECPRLEAALSSEKASHARALALEEQAHEGLHRSPDCPPCPQCPILQAHNRSLQDSLDGVPGQQPCAVCPSHEATASRLRGHIETQVLLTSSLTTQLASAVADKGKDSAFTPAPCTVCYSLQEMNDVLQAQVKSLTDLASTGPGDSASCPSCPTLREIIATLKTAKPSCPTCPPLREHITALQARLESLLLGARSSTTPATDPSSLPPSPGYGTFTSSSFFEFLPPVLVVNSNKDKSKCPSFGGQNGVPWGTWIKLLQLWCIASGVPHEQHGTAIVGALTGKPLALAMQLDIAVLCSEKSAFEIVRALEPYMGEDSLTECWQAWRALSSYRRAAATPMRDFLAGWDTHLRRCMSLDMAPPPRISGLMLLEGASVVHETLVTILGSLGEEGYALENVTKTLTRCSLHLHQSAPAVGLIGF